MGAGGGGGGGGGTFDPNVGFGLTEDRLAGGSSGRKLSPIDEFDERVSVIGTVTACPHPGQGLVLPACSSAVLRTFPQPGQENLMLIGRPL